MLKALIKKQFAELLSAMFAKRNARTGKKARQIINNSMFSESKPNMLKCTKRQASKGYLKTCLSLFCLYFYVLSDSNFS